MKKRVDFHIHTIESITDSQNNKKFDIEYLKKYIKQSKLDAIAITNHNFFDLQQYNDIKSNVEITVFPGVEVNLEMGHILVISPIENAETFSKEVNQLSEKIITQNSFITYD